MTATSFLEYRSRIDPWMAWVLMGTCALLLISCFLALIDDSSGTFSTAMVVLITLVLTPMMVWVLVGTVYRLTDTHLLIRSGPFKTDIRLDDIISVEPSRSLLSSPALSRDRFLIRYERFSTVMISPDDRASFLQEIATRAPQLIWQDEKLVTIS